MDTEFFEKRGVDMDMDTEFLEKRGVDLDMDTVLNQCPPNSGHQNHCFDWMLFEIIYVLIFWLNLFIAGQFIQNLTEKELQ